MPASPTLQFNMQIIIGEVGALLGAPLLSHVALWLGYPASIISAAASIGALVGAAVCFLGLRRHHKGQKKGFSGKVFITDLAYFTPVAFVLALIAYYPTLYFLSKHLQAEHSVLFSVVTAQLIAFCLFLIAINIYRSLLSLYVGKVL